ncbi:RND family efflux transporter MFP subunit [Rhodopseudomonas thermotolerans]|uniref:RND family efflux transporter MFP subunit n=2 Tax=Rhodopseudomonas TaxID=1073 RepID=A0A336JIV7_9BRAD|nr:MULTISPECIES: efflux RND transporter periplasmic adaptor subunit [Rhodopseudomonas]RED38838.1 RND family efflux transporter MFP subunit [Rhodopseudomonas pentothenatexigens]REG06909.1 RND family efflux transporter MFP subunit [Rhodopseudomonas thermotolerans]SSW89658.1 RND family efflux transporter MFP subunit [Rhodopseudomonas pentothenatexigens]
MTARFALPRRSHPGYRTAALLALAIACAQMQPARAQQSDVNGQTVTVFVAARACFPATVEVSGFLIPRDEVSVRPERPTAKVTDVLIDAGETVTQGQALARLEGGATVQAPVAGLVSASTALIGAPASPKGEALFTIVTRGEFDLVGQVPTRDMPQLSVGQTATVKVVGDKNEVQGKVRRISATVEPKTQLGNVFVGLGTDKRLLANASGRATIKTGESCGISVPLTAVIYNPVGTIVQVVRRQIVETRRVETGLMNGGNIEIREGLKEGDIVVERAGAQLREGDAVRPVLAAGASAK